MSSLGQGTQYALFESAEAIPLEVAPHANGERRFSDYVVYVDESGDHSLASIDPDYPVFVLALCVFHKRHYAEKIIPAVEKLKFNYFGHDSVVCTRTRSVNRRVSLLFSATGQRGKNLWRACLPSWRPATSS